MTAVSISAAETRRTRQAFVRPLQYGLADVVAIQLALAPRVRRREGSPVRAEDQSAQQRRRLARVLVGAHPRAVHQHRMDGIPQGALHNGRVLAGINLALVRDLADQGSVVEQLVDCTLVEEPPGLGENALGRRTGSNFVAERTAAKASNTRTAVAASASFTTSFRSRTS